MVELALTIIYLAPLLSTLLLFTRFQWRSIIASLSTAFSSLYLAVFSLRILISGKNILVVLTGSPSSITYVAFLFDPLSSMFLFGYGVIWFFVALYSIYYVAGKKLDEIHYWVYFNLLYLVMLSFFPASNPIITILLLDAALVLTALLIVVDRANVKARRAAIVYMVSLSIASMLALMGFLILSNEAGGAYDYLVIREWFRVTHTVDYYVMVSSTLILLGFMVKMGLVPFHIWLPRAHAEAPSTISALLSSIGVSLGAYGIIRVFFYVLELFEPLSLVLIIAGVASILYGSIYALACRDVKRLVAYSTIAHMGYVAFGLGSTAHLLESGEVYELLGSIAFASIVLYVFGHMLGKALFFLAIAGIEASIGLRDLNKLGGLSNAMRNTYRLLILIALQLIGIPPSIIYIAKSLAHTATLSSMTQVFFEASIAVIASLLTASYMLRLLLKLSTPSRDYHRLLELIERKHSRLYDKYAVLLLYGFITLMMILPLITPLVNVMIDKTAIALGAENIVEYIVVTPIIAYTRLPQALQLLSPGQELFMVISTMLIIPLLTIAAYYVWSHLEYFSVYFRRIHDELVHEKILVSIIYLLRRLQYRLEDVEYDSRFMLTLSLVFMLFLALIVLLGG